MPKRHTEHRSPYSWAKYRAKVRALIPAVVMLFAMIHMAGAGAGPTVAPPWEEQLSGLEGVYIDAEIVGADIPMMVTEEEIETEMRTRLWQAGIWVFDDPDDERDAPLLTLTFIADPIEPVFPSDEGDVVRVYPIFIDLNLTEPVAGVKRAAAPDAGAPMLVGQTWWTHVQAWAMERTMRYIACLAVKKALDQFIADYEGVRRTGKDSVAQN